MTESTVYFNGQASAVDRETFEFVNDSASFFKDKNHVYVGNDSNILLGADPKTFEILGTNNDTPLLYTRDQSKVFFGYGEVVGADSDSFQVMEEEYTSKLEAQRNGLYGKDKNSVFKNGKQVLGMDAQSFVLLGIELKKCSEEQRHRTNHHFYSKDKNGIYFNDKKINADMGTFQFVENEFTSWKDKNGYFCIGVRVSPR